VVTPLAVSAVAGAACGAGVLLLIRQCRPARPDLAAALARLDAPTARSADGPFASSGVSPAGGLPAGPAAALGRWLGARASRLPVPVADLRLLDRPVEAFWASKAAFAVLGLALPSALFTLLWLVGLSPSPVLPVVVPLAAASGLFFAPDLVIRSQAGQVRAEFRQAVGAYLELVALGRAADSGPADSLERAAAVGHGRDFTRIADALARARLVGVPPWTALGDLADTTEVSDLRDLADIVALAGNDGAAIYDTLAAKATALRARTLADSESAANAASERLTLPAVALGLGFVLLVAYPALARVLV
jgi:hypothetical protein